jgi:Cu-Zn family superoxide dismutase
LLVVAGLSLVLGCSLPAQPSVQAKSGLRNEDGQIVGSATFRDAADDVLVNMEVNAMSPGWHAVHAHAVGRCEGPAFTPSGGLRIAAAR